MIDKERFGQCVLVMQGGGALGAYQAGVFEALHEAGIEPDWVIGTSIGAINAGIIAGNRHSDRLDRLREFWTRMQYDAFTNALASIPWWGAAAANTHIMSAGLAGFFQPNPMGALSDWVPTTPENTGFYRTDALGETLADLIDIEEMNAATMRLTVGAAHVQSGDMRYFDSRDAALGVKHILASAALPPGFPAVRINGELYWDGGILSNTPVEAVFDDNPRRSGVVFSVHIWNPSGPEPDTLRRVMARGKDLQYASRSSVHIARQRQLHKLRHVITELAAHIPEPERGSNVVKALADYGCVTTMHVIRLLAPPMAGEDHTKDIDFSAKGIKARWAAGYTDTARVLDARPWEGDADPLEGFVLHEADAGEMIPS